MASESRWRSGVWRWGLGLLVGLGLIAGLFAVEDLRPWLKSAATREDLLREQWASHPWRLAILFYAGYVAFTGLMLPGAGFLTALCGWTFGIGWGLVIASFASTSGASVSFFLSRYLFHDFVQRTFHERLQRINKSIESDGAAYLFLLRLVVGVPFFLVNILMGITKIRFWTFWWTSQLGMLPGTLLYVYAGASLPDLQTMARDGLQGVFSWRLVVAFLLLGLFPLLVRGLAKRFLPTLQGDSAISTESER